MDTARLLATRRCWSCAISPASRSTPISPTPCHGCTASPSTIWPPIRANRCASYEPSSPIRRPSARRAYARS
jgi:hypothetical protein